MDEDDGRVVGEPVVFWVQGATEKQRDAHFRALRWAHVLDVEIDRLREARITALDSHEAVLAKGMHGHSDSWPFFMMDGEAHFALVAARQLLRALRAFDGDDRLPNESTRPSCASCAMHSNTGTIPQVRVPPRRQSWRSTLTPTDGPDPGQGS
jgi:hypothetical protein